MSFNPNPGTPEFSKLMQEKYGTGLPCKDKLESYRAEGRAHAAYVAKVADEREQEQKWENIQDCIIQIDYLIRQALIHNPRLDSFVELMDDFVNGPHVVEYINNQPGYYMYRPPNCDWFEVYFGLNDTMKEVLKESTEQSYPPDAELYK